jgi:hypothetical protein
LGKDADGRPTNAANMLPIGAEPSLGAEPRDKVYLDSGASDSRDASVVVEALMVWGFAPPSFVFVYPPIYGVSPYPTDTAGRWDGWLAFVDVVAVEREDDEGLVVVDADVPTRTRRA